MQKIRLIDFLNGFVSLDIEVERTIGLHFHSERAGNKCFCSPRRRILHAHKPLLVERSPAWPSVLTYKMSPQPLDQMVICRACHLERRSVILQQLHKVIADCVGVVEVRLGSQLSMTHVHEINGLFPVGVADGIRDWVGGHCEAASATAALTADKAGRVVADNLLDGLVHVLLHPCPDCVLHTLREKGAGRGVKVDRFQTEANSSARSCTPFNP
mmetsp:Transcript_26474/g.57136  ORF Transcript_26474/g.57136 Transcript_26474/m.57136 type:complete len:214 (-) Transcript_26474:520-1161(-)